MMSAIDSIPTDKRTVFSVMPLSACSSAESCWCVVEAGWITSDFESPTLAKQREQLELVDERARARQLERHDRAGPLGRYLRALSYVGSSRSPG